MLTERKIRAAKQKIAELEERLVDREREAKINALIPKAEAAARKRINATPIEERMEIVKDGVPFQIDRESYFFHEEINRMAVAAGLRNWG